MPARTQWHLCVDNQYIKAVSSWLTDWAALFFFFFPFFFLTTSLSAWTMDTKRKFFSELYEWEDFFVSINWSWVPLSKNICSYPTILVFESFYIFTPSIQRPLWSYSLITCDISKPNFNWMWNCFRFWRSKNWRLTDYIWVLGHQFACF